MAVEAVDVIVLQLLPAEALNLIYEDMTVETEDRSHGLPRIENFLSFSHGLPEDYIGRYDESLHLPCLTIYILDF